MVTWPVMQDQGDGLEGVGEVAYGRAPGTEAEVAVVLAGELIAVDAEKDAVDQVARVAGHQTEDGVEGDAFDTRSASSGSSC